MTVLKLKKGNDIMMTFLLFIHVLVSALIILLVLVQQGKGATMGAAFGSGASQTVFGSRGSGSFLLKLTLIFAMTFFVTGIALNYISMKQLKNIKHETPINLPSNVANGIPVNVNTAMPSENNADQSGLPVSSSVLPHAEKNSLKK